MKVNKRKAHQVLAMAVLGVAGCEYIGPQLHQKTPLPQPAVVQELPSVNQNADTTPKTAKVEIFPSEDNTGIATRTAPTVAGGSGGKGEFSLNFDDADLGEVAKVILSDILGRNYTISPQVSGKVTLQTTKPLTRDELLPTLEMLLNLNSAALVTQGDMYLIKPSNEAVYSTSIRTFGNTRIPSGYQTRIVPVRNVSAGEIVDILKPLLPEKSLLQADPNRNVLLVSGSASDLSRIMDVISIFDVDVLKGRSFALFTPAHVDASKIIEELEVIFARSASGDSKEASSKNEFFRFIEIERMNAILAITHNEKYLHDIENWILRLDRINVDANGGVNVYRAQHVSAVDLADTLNDIFGNGSARGSRSASIASGRKSMSATNKQSGSGRSGGGSTSSSSAGKTSSLSERSLGDSSTGSTQDKTGTAGTRGRGGSGSIGSTVSASASGALGTNSSEMANVKIIADEGNNALVIVAKSEEYAKIQQVLKQLDVLPLQVLIEATIVEVDLKNDLKYGIEWYLSKGHSAISGGDVGAEGIDFTSIATGAATGGFSYAFASKNINAILHAEATKDNINIISSPSLMVLNNQEASIRVGDSVPVQTGSVTSGVTNNPGVTSSIQMMDTGINLSLRPRVNSGGLVLMDILQSTNDVKPSKETPLNPTIAKREIETSVVVQSGETVVLGGMIRESNTYNRFGFPVLHEIPLLGPLFGSTTRNKDKTELVVLLTPRVVNSRQDAASITDEFRRKLSSIYEVPAEPAPLEETETVQ